MNSLTKNLLEENLREKLCDLRLKKKKTTQKEKLINQTLSKLRTSAFKWRDNPQAGREYSITCIW